MKKYKLIFPLLLLLLIFSCGPDDPTCFDGERNGSEIEVDCGGPDCVNCITCSDGIQNGAETSVDCGGPECPACPSCLDGIMNGNETDIDCGGPDCPPCFTCTDGIMNGSEAGIDCGGPDCPACVTCADGIMNGDETGIDCGGPDCLPCYSIGFAGPGNGVVFYDKGNYNDGWRYMETAVDIQGTNETWGCIYELVNGTSLALGTGLANTEAIVSFHGANTCDKMPEAALQCYNFSSNGLDDWFLPSVNELKEMFKVKSEINVASFRYWSSSESNNEDAYVVDFSAVDVDQSSYTYFKIPVGGQQGNARIKPIRRF